MLALLFLYNLQPTVVGTSHGALTSDPATLAAYRVGLILMPVFTVAVFLAAC
jgi:hypothetical protein